jgi:hypothetical protein
MELKLELVPLGVAVDPLQKGFRIKAVYGDTTALSPAFRASEIFYVDEALDRFENDMKALLKTVGAPESGLVPALEASGLTEFIKEHK